MTQSADFYLGRGKRARYLGTVTVEDASPEALRVSQRFGPAPNSEQLFGAQDYRAAVAQLIEQYDGTISWPHSYPTSHDTDFVYSYEAASVYVHELGGYIVSVLYCNGTRKPAEFPAWP